MSSTSSSFDQDIEKATNDANSEENWAIILEICDKVTTTSNGPKECLKSIMKKLANGTKTSQKYALTVLDSCVQNCGLPFRKEIASSQFVQEARGIITKAPTDVADKLKELIRKWAENDFKTDVALSAIPNFHKALKAEGAYFGMGSPSSSVGQSKPTSGSTVATSKEEEDLAKAIALSLKEAEKEKQGKPSTSLYPTVTAPVTTANYSTVVHTKKTSEKQVRALYDFEAAEDNELTFKTGELINIIDDSDANWWKGSTWRGEGLFPANFVTTDLTMEPTNDWAHSGEKKSVQFSDKVEVQQFDLESVQISEEIIDKALNLIQNADPTGLTEDSQEMLQLEEECKAMIPLIDEELQRIDRKHDEIMTINQKLIESYQLYTKLMHEATTVSQYSKYATPNVVPKQPQVSQLPIQQQGAPPYALDQAAMQSYYNQAGYAVQANSILQQQAAQPDPANQYNPAALLQQYQAGGTSLSNIQFIPSYAGVPSASIPYSVGGVPMSYHMASQ